MTAKDIFKLRKQGWKEEAYEKAQLLYATDKSGYATAAMFWTAIDILRSRVNEGKTDEAKKILMALERLLPNVPDKEGWVNDAMSRCRGLLEKGVERHHRTENRAVNISVGTWGEELAAAYLREKGYVILNRDWHSSHRDIDIIAQKGEWLVFVEVKTRSSDNIVRPVQAINWKKQRNLVQSINHYLHYRNVDQPWRFDVISIVGSPGKEPEIEHIEDFQLSIR
jgi:uncharacterized protein (TIGR00252 family)